MAGDDLTPKKPYLEIWGICFYVSACYCFSYVILYQFIPLSLRKLKKIIAKTIVADIISCSSVLSVRLVSIVFANKCDLPKIC